MKQPKKILDKITGGLFGDLFSSTEPILKEGQRLHPKQDIKANYSHLVPLGFKGYYADSVYCLIKKDMILKFHSEDKLKMFFTVASNFHLEQSEKDQHAKDKAIIFILKSNFDIKNFKL